MLYVRRASTSCFLYLVLCRTPSSKKREQDYKTNGYDSNRNSFSKRLEPHSQISATSSALREGAETPVALAHSRVCTKELMHALPNDVSLEKFEATVGQTHGMS